MYTFIFCKNLIFLNLTPREVPLSVLLMVVLAFVVSSAKSTDRLRLYLSESKRFLKDATSVTSYHFYILDF